MTTKLLDCTLRDGGYYNQWNFSKELVSDYLKAMDSLGVAYVELGLRSLKNKGFKGPFAYTSDEYIDSLAIPEGLNGKLGVMVNGSEFLPDHSYTPKELTAHQTRVCNLLFDDQSKSRISLVRVACHVHEFKDCLGIISLLKSKGYKVGFNLMQIAEYPDEKIEELAQQASNTPLDVLYFADSMGSLKPADTDKIIQTLRRKWQGELGIHTHDNMGQAIANTQQAVQSGVTWVDATVTGMGRGPGNAQTEYVTLSIEGLIPSDAHKTTLYEAIRTHFKPMQSQYGWGMNHYYYLAGEYSIHPTYIQEMLADSRYSEEDIMATIEYLSNKDSKSFRRDTLDAAKMFYKESSKGRWIPKKDIAGRQVLILGTGSSVKDYATELEQLIRKERPYVIALNTQSAINENLINIRAACHPVRLLSDAATYNKLSQPLVAPLSLLPKDITQIISQDKVLDFGIDIQQGKFEFGNTACTIPCSLVMAYALAIATSGNAQSILLAGFDGYPIGDLRNNETEYVFKTYSQSEAALNFISITPTLYEIESKSLFGPIS